MVSTSHSVTVLKRGERIEISHYDDVIWISQELLDQADSSWLTVDDDYVTMTASNVTLTYQLERYDGSLPAGMRYARLVKAEPCA